MRKLLLSFYLLFLIPNIVLGGIVEIYSLNQMDDDRGFCIDIRGHKSKAKVNRGLQAHTCYSYQGEVAVDQGFDTGKLMENQFHLPAFNVCMEAASVTASASLQLTKCRDGQLQRFDWDKEGRIHLMGDENLCLTVAQRESRKGGGGSPVHLIRNLSMETCGDTLKPFQRWGMRAAD
jgi:hypothetical protein